MTPEELKELREIVGKAIGMDGPYTWGIDDYVAVAEHFKEKGRRQCAAQAEMAREIVEWLRHW